MTTIWYTSKATMEIKPTIVELNFSINTESLNPKNAIDTLKKKVNIVKQFCKSKKSYKSHKQSNIGFYRKTIKEYYYKNERTGTVYSEKEYKNLNQTDKEFCKRYYRDIQGPYVSYTTIQVILSNDSTVIADFTDIMNMSMQEQLKITYNHTITNDERTRFMKQLYIDCVNEGMEDIRHTAKSISCLDESKIELVSIDEPNIDNNMTIGRNCKSTDIMNRNNFEPEQFFVPKLMEELFNNNITLNKAVNLKVNIG